MLQINMNNNKEGMQTLDNIVKRQKIALCIISEPNKAKSKHRMSDTWITAAGANTAIWWTGQNTTQTIQKYEAGNNVTWTQITDGTSIISCYCSPNQTINEYQDILETIGRLIERSPRKVIVAGDFNAKNPLWGGTETDTRGERLLGLAAHYNLTILNTGLKPTRERADQESYIDVTMRSEALAQKITAWKVIDEETLSDHNYITFDLKDEIPRRQKTKTSRINPREIDYKKLKEQIISRTENLTSSSGTQQLTELLLEATRKAHVALPTAIQNKNQVYWWTEEIAQQRKKAIKIKRQIHTERGKLRRRESDRTRLEELTEEYRIIKHHYRKAMAKSKQDAWRSMCETIDLDPFGKPYKIVMNKIGAPPKPIKQELIPEIISTLFPTREKFRPPNITVNQQDIPDISDEEIELLCEKSPRRKAPGPDGIPSEIIKTLMKQSPDTMKKLILKQLKEGKFPPEGKIALLILLPKPGKPPDSPSAYRPICLINTLAKTIESIINARLSNYLEANHGFSPNQYGFRRNRSTIAASRKIMEAAEIEQVKTKYQRQLCLLTLLDVKNAFNSLSWRVVNRALEEKQVPPYLRRIIGDYLHDRWIMEGGTKYGMTAGVPQGSVLGPTLWNVAYDSVLQIALPDNTEAVAYADDLALITKGRTVENLETTTNRALRAINYWMSDHELILAPEKSEAILLVGKKRNRDPSIFLANTQIQIKHQAKYLGIILDKRLTFTKHIEYATNKAKKVSNQLARALPRTSDVSQQNRRLLATVAESIALYGAPVWAEKAMKLKTNRTKLLSAQRITSTRVARTHRTVSTEALMVLASTPPWTLLAKERHELYENRLQNERITVDQIKENTLDNWQEEWQSAQTSKGSWTRTLIPDLKKWVKRRHGNMTYFLAQVLSGHGKFQSYLKRMKKVDTDTCPYCRSGEVDDVVHTIYKCEAFNHLRKRFKLTDGQTGETHLTETVEFMLESPEAWHEIATEAEAILRKKSELEKRLARDQGTHLNQTQSTTSAEIG